MPRIARGRAVRSVHAVATREKDFSGAVARLPRVVPLDRVVEVVARHPLIFLVGVWSLGALERFGHKVAGVTRGTTVFPASR